MSDAYPTPSSRSEKRKRILDSIVGYGVPKRLKFTPNVNNDYVTVERVAKGAFITSAAFLGFTAGNLPGAYIGGSLANNYLAWNDAPMDFNRQRQYGRIGKFPPYPRRDHCPFLLRGVKHRPSKKFI